MKIKKICCLVCVLFLIVGCGESIEEQRKKAIEKNQRYEAAFPKSYRKLLNDYENNKIPIIEKPVKINGCVFYLVNGIYGWESGNKRLKEAGYNVSLNTDSLSFFIFKETQSHNVGSYSNGGSASRIDTKVIALDVRNKVAYVLKRDFGSQPPRSISRRKGDKTGSVGSYLTDEEIYSFLVSEILVKP